MRLLEFRPRAYRNLRNTPILFTLDPNHEPTIACSIRFLVGVNGTGKTTLLRFMAAIFAAVDEDYRRPRPENPAYSAPFDLAYQLRNNTIIISSTGRGRSGVTFTVNGRRFEPGDIPGRDLVLPAALMICSSGDVHAWRALLQPTYLSTAEQIYDRTQKPPSELMLDEEWPLDVAVNNLAPYLDEGTESVNGDAEPGGLVEEAGVASRIFLAKPKHLPLALLVACITHDASKTRTNQVEDRQPAATFASVLDHAHISRLLSFSLQLKVDPNSLNMAQRRLLRRLYDLATIPLRQFEEQLWVFDFDEVRGEQQLASRIVDALSDKGTFQPFQFFQALVSLQEAGILLSANLIVAKRDPSDPNQPARVLVAENLSDGERAFLERMALVHLLRESECLFLFDEPETHFNDTWKRELVNHIERTLIGTHSEVILTTHASVTLTDAYPEEVILLSYRGQENVPLTLAAEPGELLRSVFGASVSVGERAERRVRDVIAAGSDEDLRALLNQVGVGYFRIKVLEELQRRGLPPRAPLPREDR